MEKNKKRCRYINESYTDIYLSIPTIITGLILLNIYKTLALEILYICYLYLVGKVFITIRKTRKKNDNIVLNGIPNKCEITSFQILKYDHTLLENIGPYYYGERSMKFNREVFKLVLKIENNEDDYYSDILFTRLLHKVNCNTIYTLNDEIYPLLIKEKNSVGKYSYNSNKIDEYIQLRLLRGYNLAFNTLIPIAILSIAIIQILLK